MNVVPSPAPALSDAAEAARILAGYQPFVIAFGVIVGVAMLCIAISWWVAEDEHWDYDGASRSAWRDYSRRHRDAQRRQRRASRARRP